ncbi:polysaccharide biosynthesis tyrosine autokinase [Microbacterium hydrocarbonoxydans]|uniref:polysaccharide biosynthesis tyrosine autokinase n=1 Tax=Microbacterium hydrocarbonoxydans TaxID=273678 RepID=UPI0007BBA418|nr:polysaccharide biosynthesis tyrosine autokinase [Microbacterium hydrocarbonoxydans]GAT72210.1 lipopolysaccharide biosynthesis protein [Microbacterium sp. HM58-2]
MEIRDYLLALRRHGIGIVLLVLVGLGAGYGWAAIQTPVYQASASGFLKTQITDQEGVALAPSASDSFAKAKVQTYLDMATWTNVAEFAADELGIDTAPENLVRQIAVVNPQNTAILKITATGSTPEAARDLASAWVRGMTATIDEFEGDGSPGSAPVGIILGESASLPTSPSFPDERTALLVGGVLGLGAGIAFALLRALSDRRVRAGDDVEQRLGVSVLGSIPNVGKHDPSQRLIDLSDTSTKGGFAVAESLRALRTNLQFMDVDHPPRRIVVTSALPGEGKSTVAANLATMLAANGEHVALVDGDLRRPTVAVTMGLLPGAGLTDVLAGRAELIDVLQRTQRVPGLVVLGAGTIPPNPSELLGSDRMRSLLAELAEHAIVIIDAPPLLAVTDGAILTHQADGAIVVVTVGSSTYDLVDKAMDALEKVSGRVLGVVLNRTPLSGGSTNYGYGYHPHEPTAAEEPEAKASRHRNVRTAPRPGGGVVRTGRKPQPRSEPQPATRRDDFDEDAALEELFDEAAIETAKPKRQPSGRRGTE